MLGLVALALLLSCFDSWIKFFLPTPDWALHQRSSFWLFGCLALLVAVVQLTRVPSTAVTLGAGFFAGGVLGNLVSAGIDHLVVPNPLLLSTRDGGFAYNPADMFILAGNLILMIALCDFVIRHRDRLPRHPLKVRVR
jgi:lipoprotein signal peptidase